MGLERDVTQLSPPPRDGQGGTLSVMTAYLKETRLERALADATASLLSPVRMAAQSSVQEGKEKGGGGS